MLETAASQVQRWDRTDIFLSVNVSAVQIQQADFLAEVEAALEHSGLPAERLVLEITESAMFRDTQATIDKLTELRALGHPDRDRRLRHRLLVADLPAPLPGRHPEDRQGLHRSGHRRRRRSGRSPARSWRSAAGSGSQVVAEGVEDQGQLARLRGMGCELGQGFYFARPAPLDQLIPRNNRFLAGDQAVSRVPGLDRADIATD